jgi:outer membrane protein assembly factor BamA
VRQRVNNLLDPTRGSVISGEATVSSRYLGSSSLQQFVRLSGDAAWYRPLGRSIVVAARIKGGVIFSPDVVLGSGEPLGFVPPDQRFYAGGPNDLRGYDRNELGPVVYVVPRDSLKFNEPQTGDTSYNATALRVAATGGDRLAIANVEFRFPAPFLSERFKLAAFVDAGALWSRERTAGLRVTPGVGIRVASPLGPVRFDFGYNPYQLERGAVYTNTEAGDLVLLRESDRRERTRNFTIHFSIGHAF